AKPGKEMNFQARGSSVYSGRPDLWGPKLAINGNISSTKYYYFHTVFEMHPWLEVKLPSPVLIESVTIVNRMNACRERLRNVEVRAGMVPVPEGFTLHDVRGESASKKLDVNSRCGYFPGPAAGRFIEEGHVIKFDQPTLAQYITVQILEAGYLQINGLKINGGPLPDF
ncbi:putative E3 ubiquitin-protein ligase herc1, partial [Desmophyllum pertusum]